MLINYNNSTCLDNSISSEILDLSMSYPKAKLKIIHNDQLEPFPYAIGFGCKTNSSLIVGGFNQKDWFSSRLLLTFAKTLCLATSQNNSLLGIKINEIFEKKGVWIIPKFNDVSNSTAMNYIIEKLNPRQLLQIQPCGEKVRYYPPKISSANTKIFAYLLATSCGYSIDNNTLDDENNLCNWFMRQLSRPAYSLHIGKYEDFNIDDLEVAFNRLLEGLILYICS